MVLAISRGQGADTAARMLEVLRRYREAPTGSSIRWLLTGSVGFHHALRGMERGDSFVNDLDNLPLGPLSDAWCEWLAASLLAGAGVDAGQPTIIELARVSGGIPFLAHLVAKEARDRQLSTMAVGDVEPLFDEVVNDLDKSQQATHFLSRLGPYYGDQTASAEWILDRVAERASTRDDVVAAAKRHQPKLQSGGQFRDILDWLCLDHYLVKSPGPAARYEWRYPPLARVWRIRRS